MHWDARGRRKDYNISVQPAPVPPSPSLTLRLLGAPRLERAGRAVPLERRKALALLAYLAVTGQPQPRDTLAALLWPEANASEARAALRRALSVLTTSLEGAGLDSRRETIAATPEAIGVDVLEFRRLLRETQAHHPAGEAPCGTCLERLAEAAELYRGEFMAGFTLRDSPDFDEWQFQLAENLRRDLAAVLEGLARGYGADGDYRAALEPARRWVALDPLHEPAQRTLMRLYALAGQPTAAQRAYLEARRLLEAELNTPPEPETTRLYDDIRAGRIQPAGAAAPLRGLPDELPVARREAAGVPARSAHLPAPSTPLLGRVAELALLAERLADPACRLVTVVGPGGSGKTRLALHAAAGHGARTSLPVAFVPLASAPSPEVIAAAIAEALGLANLDEADPTGYLLAALHDRQLLLLLDNFEHLLPGAGLLADVLAQAPGLRLVVTSRERLHLHGEWVLELAGLPFPPDASAPNIDFYEAVQLFLQSARQARGSFVLDDATRPAVVDICRLVEGLPLGLELAAAWTRVLSPAEIATEITRNLDFLATNRRDVPARQRSLRAAFEHSWQLLGPGERDALSRLTIFQRAFGRQAAEAVAGAGLTTLAALADKSLLRALPPRRGLAQYELHEQVRQFAGEKLAETSSEAEAARREHARYYAAMLARLPAEKHCPIETQMELYGDVAAEVDNARAAWQWAVAQGDLDLMEQAGPGLFSFFRWQSWYQEARELMGHAAQRVAELTPALPSAERPRAERLLASLLGAQGMCYTYLGLQAKAQPLFAQSLALMRAHGQSRELAQFLTRSAWLERELGRVAEARRLMEESVTQARASGDVAQVVSSLHMLGYFLGEMGAFDAALANTAEAVALAREAELLPELGNALNSQGFVCYLAGDLPRALDLLEQALAARPEAGHSRAVTLDNLGYVRLAQGAPRGAQRHFLEALALASDMHNVGLLYDILVGCAMCLPLPEEGSRAVELLAFVAHSARAWRESRERAEPWLRERAGQLPPEVAAAAIARGQALVLEEVVAELLADSKLAPQPAT
jgi:predicted ATPase/DNA-binding SARP family transcriptional activator